MGFVLTVTENNNQNRYFVPVKETDKIRKVRSMAVGMMDTARENVRLFLNGQPIDLLERTDAQYGLHKKSISLLSAWRAPDRLHRGSRKAQDDFDDDILQ
ncbi:hypothetical protein niasHT_027268 [Heterodera trifolii]|uniref:Uncharacterized protein n=1 Tax=Heterodera trifolii TaxID=157864 RepID=A0ABD2JTU1_9BILA